MQRVPKTVILFILPIVLAKLAEMILSSRPGKRVANRLGQPELTTEKGVELASDYSRKVATVLGAAATDVQTKLSRTAAIERPAGVSWGLVMQDTADLLLAT